MPVRQVCLAIIALSVITGGISPVAADVPAADADAVTEPAAQQVPHSSAGCHCSLEMYCPSRSPTSLSLAETTSSSLRVPSSFR